MILRGRAVPAFLVPLALCFGVLGGWTVYEESAGVMFEPGLSGIARVARSIGDDEIGGLWTRTQQGLLKNCEYALLTRKALETRFLPPETQAALGPHCQSVALSAAARYPTDSYAWSVAALAAADLQDWPGMNDALLRSQLTGATELWIAKLRVIVAQNNFVMLDTAAQVAARQDLRLLLTSNKGIRDVAQRYVRDAAFRPRVEAEVETMPAEIQRRFVIEVRYQMS